MSKRWIALMCFLAASCGGGDGSGSGGSGNGGSGSTPPAPISITSPSSASVAENTSAPAYQVTTSGGGTAATYALSGVDASAFTINGAGAVLFKTPPDFEQPTDSDKNNSYVVTVSITDSSGTATRDVTITVTNVADMTAVASVGGRYFGADHIAAVPGQARVFVAQSDGRVFLVDPSTTEQGTLYLTVGGAELRSLTAVAAAPDFATSGTLYAAVLTTTALEVRRYGRTSSGVGDAASADVILRVAITDSPNTGGWLGFGADGLLYVTTGNSANIYTTRPEPEPPTSSSLGKVLRVDVTRDDFPADPVRDYGIPSSNPFVAGGGAGEVYAAGFKHPRTAAFDGSNLYVGDQNNVILPSTTPLYLIRPTDAGRTFSDNAGGQTIPPVLRAGQTLTGAGLLVAGPVYRGPSPDLTGRYFFRVSAGLSGMSYSGVYTIPAANLVQGTTISTRDCCTLFNGASAVAFGEDASRNLYFTDGSMLYMVQYR